MEEEFLNTTHPMMAPAVDLSVLLISLLKGVLYRDGDERQWAALLNLQARVRDYVAVLNLDLVLDEAEGYAFLKSRPEPADAPAFADVADPDTAKAAQWCVEQGLMKRRLNGKFAPGSSIPAYQVLNAYRKLAG